MTDKELHRLTRAELLELLIMERREIDRLSEECKRLKAELKIKKQLIENSVSDTYAF